MKRPIKFRSKRLDNGEWVYGHYADYIHPDCGIPSPSIIYPLPDCGNMIVAVNPSTTGQFTGLMDRHGTEIYEGDILQWSENGCKSNPMEVVVKYGAFGYLYYGFHSLVGNTNFTFYLKGTDSRFEIIGNIHDNPELQILK